MEKEFPFIALKNYFLRTPSLTLNYYYELANSEDVEIKIREALRDPFINEALYLASPVLHKQSKLWLKKEIKNEKKNRRIRISLLKYLVRMSTRCTPFGLFAGCSVGQIDKETKIETLYGSFRRTRYDMHFISSLANHIANIPEVKSQLKFFPNSTLYRLGERYRYVEYSYVNGKRQHTLESVIYSQYLEEILNLAKGGADISQMVNRLISLEIEKNEAISFVNKLVKNQILINELEPTITGRDFLELMIEKVSNMDINCGVIPILKNLEKLLQELDYKTGYNLETYKKAVEYISSLKIDFQPQYLFQTNLYNRLKINKVNKRLVKQIEEVIKFLNRFDKEFRNGDLEDFKKAFRKRYDGQKVPLLNVLDIESGIGYANHFPSSTFFLDEILIHRNDEKIYDTNQLPNSTVTMLLSKLQEALREGKLFIMLTDNDLNNLDVDWQNSPDSLSCLGEIFVENGIEKIYIPHLGSHANRLLARFANDSIPIKNIVSTVTRKEDRFNADSVLAEIVHVPESRTGNILRRPQIRKYEIPYLGMSSVPLQYQIPLQDLLVSVEGDTIVLYSQKLSKKVLPKLSNAHAYKQNALPVYHFLCDLQFQNQRNYTFSWGRLAYEIPFLPRVVYKNVVLSKATWLINTKTITSLIELHYNKESTFFLEVKKWQKKIGLPKRIQLVESDNALLIDFDSLPMVEMLFEHIKNRKTFKLKEFFHDKGAIVHSANEEYTSEFVFMFNKSFEGFEA